MFKIAKSKSKSKMYGVFDASGREICAFDQRRKAIKHIILSDNLAPNGSKALIAGNTVLLKLIKGGSVEVVVKFNRDASIWSRNFTTHDKIDAFIDLIDRFCGK